MPIYEYRCKKGHTFEVMQRMAEDPIEACPTCKAAVQRVFHPIAVHFKGSGFYATDYGKKKGSGAKDGKGESDSSSEKSSSESKKSGESGSGEKAKASSKSSDSGSGSSSSD